MHKVDYQQFINQRLFTFQTVAAELEKFPFGVYVLLPTICNVNTNWCFFSWKSCGWIQYIPLMTWGKIRHTLQILWLYYSKVSIIRPTKQLSHITNTLQSTYFKFGPKNNSSNSIFLNICCNQSFPRFTQKI